QRRAGQDASLPPGLQGSAVGALRVPILAALAKGPGRLPGLGSAVAAAVARPPLQQTTGVSVSPSPGAVESLGRDVVVAGAPGPAAPNAATMGPGLGPPANAPVRAGAVSRGAPGIAAPPLLFLAARSQDEPELGS